MKILIYANSESIKKIAIEINKIKGCNVENVMDNQLTVEGPDIESKNKEELEKIKTQLQFTGVTDIIIIPPKINEGNNFTISKAQEKYNIFVDVDGTITDGSRFVDPRSYRVFQKMQKLGHNIFLNSGRPTRDIIEILGQINPDRIIGVAEYGAVLVISREDNISLGDKEVCQNALKSLSNCIQDELTEITNGPLKLASISLS